MRETGLGLALAMIALGCGSARAPSVGSDSAGPPPNTGTGPGGAPASDGGTGPGGAILDGGTAVPSKHTLNVRVAGTGDVLGAPTDCRNNCLYQLDDGQTMHLVATQQIGSRFEGWQGDCGGTGACDLTMSADRTVVASFSSVATLTILPTGTGSGRVISSPTGIDCPRSCTTMVQLGTSMTLTAYSDANSTFRGWSGACSGGGVCKLAAFGDQIVEANFEARPQPPISSCKGIAPPDTPPMMQYVEYPRDQIGFDCGGAAGDASGALALVVKAPHADGIRFVGPSGTLLGGGGASMYGFPLQQPIGFTHVSGKPYLGPSWAMQYGQMLSDFDSAGKSTGVSTLANHSGQLNLPAAADPNGGVLFAGDLAMGEFAPTLHAALMYNGGSTSASVRWGPKVLASSGAVFGLGVDLLGRSLVITDGGSRFGGGNISAQWFDRYGAALTGEFALLTNFSPGPSTWFETTALIGGGVLVRRMDGASHAQALVVVESGRATVSPAPDWMQSRRDVKLQIARGGKAYAALPLGANGVSCRQRVEVVAPDGTSCGATDYPIAGGTCDTSELLLGADGTIIQQLPTSLEQTNSEYGVHTCTWRWWPAALR